MHILKGFSKKSIRFKLIVGVLLLIVPLQSLLLYDNYYAMQVVQEQVANSNRNLTALYMDQIDHNLEEVSKYLKMTVAFESDLLLIDVPREDNSDSYNMARIYLFNKIERDIANYRTIDLFFVYSSINQDLITNQPSTESVAQLQATRAGIIRMLQEKVETDPDLADQWFTYKLDDQYYLYKIQKLGQVYIGAWVLASKLMVPISLLDMGDDGKSLLVTEQYEPMDGLTTLGDEKQYLHVSTPSSQGNFSLLILMPYRDILAHLPDLRRVWYLVLIGSLVIIPFFYMFLRQVILLPINRIVTVMRRVRDGNLEHRVNSSPVSYEFELMNDVFNGMVAQIKDLKIHVYEEQLLKQKAELKHLQLQINPHFFLNALNTIYNLAQFRNYQLIQEMSEYMMKYLRFMFQSNMKFVSLADELAHTENYLRIQAVRFHEGFTYELRCPEAFSGMQIPPLLIQTFVENIIKHAITMNEPIKLGVDIRHSSEHGAMMSIIIWDTGKGFSLEALQQFQQDVPTMTDGDEQIGIWNAKQRLKLIYKEKASLQLSNRPDGGAQVKLLLPLIEEAQEGYNVSIAYR
ncbi:sensor histidine kinase [Paenibacillus sp. IITD108]|uniref:sensor histidine kinase n=1 Tax=Paenibacillus sp. IITD108 TaxID=3116649 RepID=UPI002F40605C